MKLDNPTHYQHRVYQNAVNRFGMAATLVLCLAYFIHTYGAIAVAIAAVHAILWVACIAFIIGVVVLVLSELLPALGELWDFLCGG